MKKQKYRLQKRFKIIEIQQYDLPYHAVLYNVIGLTISDSQSLGHKEPTGLFWKSKSIIYDTTVIKQRKQNKRWVSSLKEVIVGYSLIQP